MARGRVKRSYDGSRRTKAAECTRENILRVARRCFVARGYVATTMSEIARQAGVALDTVYASLGTKQVLFQTLVETAISGTTHAIAAEERGYVRAIRAEPDVRRKLAIYAGALRAVHERLAPLLRVLKDAAGVDASLAKLGKDLEQRRAANMRLFASDLSAGLRTDQTRADIADVIWATGSSELYLLLTQERSWSPAKYEAWLEDAWAKLLLAGAT